MIMRIRGRDLAINFPFVLLMVVIGILPFANALIDSFYHIEYESRIFAGLENFRYLTEDRGFAFSLNITVLWAFAASILTLVMGFLIALRILDTARGSRTLFQFLLIPWGIPVYIAVPLWRALLHGNGGESVITRLTGVTINLMVDPAAGFLSAMAVNLWMGVPLTAFVLAAHMKKIPVSVLEAAQLDGASRGRIALHIILPFIRDSAVIMSLRNLIKGFKEFTLVFLLTGGGPPLVQGITRRYVIGATSTLGMFLYDVFTGTSDWGISAAYGLMMAAIVLVAMLMWMLARRNASQYALLLVTAFAQIPGGNPALLIIVFMYLICIPFRKAFPWVFAIHSLLIAYRIAAMGYLSGFHPGYALSVLAAVIIWKNAKMSKNSRRDIRVRKTPVGGMINGSSIVVAWLMVIVTAVILYLLVWMSLSRVSAVYMTGLLPAMPSMSNFIRLFSEEGILRNFANTLLIAGISAGLLPLIAFPTAVWLHRRGSKWTLGVLAVIQILEMAGGMHSLIPLYRIFLFFRLIDSFIPLILIYIYQALPFTLFVLTAYLNSTPKAYRDIAELEGMPMLSFGFRILFPLSLPAILTTVMAAFIGAWNGFLPALLFLNDEGLYPISLRLFGYVGSIASGTPVWNLFAAASTVNLLLIGFLLIRFRNPMVAGQSDDFPD
jgi:multiple sugar transport system permease protein